MQQQPTWLSAVPVVRQACKVGLLGSLALAGLMLLGGAARAGESIHNVLDDGWATAVSVRFSGRLTEAHAGSKAEGGALSTLRRQAKNLLATGEEGRVAWRVGSLQWQTRADDLGYWEWRGNVPLPPAALGAGWHTIQSDPVASSAGSAGTPGVPPGHAAGLLVHDPRNTSGLISDIDDTILVTQVLDKPRLLKNTLTIPPESRQAVAGMAALYQRLASQLPDPTAAPLFYLSASPRQITDSVRRFLAHNQFPRGVLQLREVSTQARSRDPLTDTQAYKIQRIQAILDAFPEVRFVLVGDDAEHDPETYAHLQQTQPQRIHSVWIRRIHPDPARPRPAGQRDLAQLLAGAQPWPISAPRAD